MNCNDVRGSFELMLDGEADTTDRTTMLDHIRDCEQCQGVWNDLQYQKRILQSYRSSIRMSDLLAAKIRKLMSEMSPPPPPAIALSPPPPPAIALSPPSRPGLALLNRAGDFTEDEANQSSQKYITSELLREDLIACLNDLSTRERDVLRLRFGLDDGRQRTLEEVGQLYGITVERVRTIEAKALRRLRNPNRKANKTRNRR